jgi:peptidoglycan hydrolase CwlO-like protein
MYNWFGFTKLKKEHEQLIEELKNGYNPYGQWTTLTGFNTINGETITSQELADRYNNLLEDIKNLKDRNRLLESAIERWQSRANCWEKSDVELQEMVSELTKEILSLRHLKTENVELIERLQKKSVSFSEAALQIIQNDYAKCTEQRDEYKHQLNAADKEIEALKIKLRDYQDKFAESFSYHDMKKLQNKIDELTLMYKERDTKLKTYNGTLLGQIAGLKEENEKLDLQIVALHKIIEGAKKTIDEQKHPMYPIHWGGYDKNIKEFIESELNNEDPVDGVSDLLQKAKDLTEDVEVDLDNSLDEQCDDESCYICNKCNYKIAHDTNYYGGCGFCKEGKMVEKWCTTKVAMQDAVQAKQREVYGIENNFSEEKVPHVMVDYVWIPVDQTEFIGISEDLFGKDVYEFEYNGKVYTSHVILKYKN